MYSLFKLSLNSLYFYTLQPVLVRMLYYKSKGGKRRARGGQLPQICLCFQLKNGKQLNICNQTRVTSNLPTLTGNTYFKDGLSYSFEYWLAQSPTHHSYNSCTKFEVYITLKLQVMTLQVCKIECMRNQILFANLITFAWFYAISALGFYTL